MLLADVGDDGRRLDPTASKRVILQSECGQVRERLMIRLIRVLEGRKRSEHVGTDVAEEQDRVQNAQADGEVDDPDVFSRRDTVERGTGSEAVRW